MKLAITSTGNNLESKIDLRFGRTAWLCIYDNETKNIQFIENKHKDLLGGAGTQTSETIAELGVQQVISGDFGPKAKTLLEKLKIQMVILDEENVTIKRILNKFENKN
jgi:predicted Fe-Mo cluster-binding NifX family protein